ncbi:EamA family transporter [Halobellus sp. H-GB7]|uniref:EamA family transporter n=1 Tax=Halobellus sp. H-GB7 TaxID=3069756 RepID=UPI0027B44EFE|nr:EamA family transporter [Halobellus sp. H-GB7]MDQ2056186.1 EamA family transporter [Halobellus sp. H-GB7]
MEYLPWVIVALVSYGMLAPLTSKVTQEVPPTVSLFVATVVFLVLTLGVMAVTDTNLLSYVFLPAAGYIYVGGVFLGIGILSYYIALQRGPVSVVVPIYGMFIVGSSVIGILFLDEAITLTRVGGITSAILAVYLSSGAE